MLRLVVVGKIVLLIGIGVGALTEVWVDVAMHVARPRRKTCLHLLSWVGFGDGKGCWRPRVRRVRVHALVTRQIQVLRSLDGAGVVQSRSVARIHN